METLLLSVNVEKLKKQYQRSLLQKSMSLNDVILNEVKNLLFINEI